MSKEKQIEEMAEMLEIIDNARETYAKDVTDHTENEYIREGLLNANYRKQSEGKWRSELVKKCDWKGKKHDYYQPNSCSLCHEAVLKRTPFCPNCGAKMKGGAE